MKCIEVAKLSFDPETTENLKDIFECHQAKVLWCCIKNNHVTSQFFNKKILSVGLDLQKNYACSYTEFIKICSPLSDFGIVNIREFGHYHRETDHEYWGGIYEKAIHHAYFKIEILPPEAELEDAS